VRLALLSGRGGLSISGSRLRGRHEHASVRARLHVTYGMPIGPATWTGRELGDPLARLATIVALGTRSAAPESSRDSPAGKRRRRNRGHPSSRIGSAISPSISTQPM